MSRRSTNVGEDVSSVIVDSYRTEMEAFDRLPKPLRHALANANLQYSAVQAEQLLKERKT